MAHDTYGEGGDFFGLDEFGEPVGLNPMYGGLAGAAVGTGTAIAIRKFALATSVNAHKYSELIGAAAGVAAGAVLWFSKQKAAGITAALVSAVNGGLRQMESSMATTGAVHGAWGERTIEPRTLLQGLGMRTIEPRTALQGHELGAGRPQAHFVGQQAQFVGPPSLTDAQFAASPAARQARLLGAPPLSQLSSLYGSNHFNKN